MLRWAALFLGELRDGLTMINMQSAFLIVSRHYSEKQAGVLFFGMWSNRLAAVNSRFTKAKSFPNMRLLHVARRRKCQSSE
jgi:hypothetical protein